MFIDMTFRFDVPEDLFDKIQVILADSANQVDNTHRLYSKVEVPISNSPRRNFSIDGTLVGVVQAF